MTCKQCGAIMVLDKDNKKVRCPYCGNINPIDGLSKEEIQGMINSAVDDIKKDNKNNTERINLANKSIDEKPERRGKKTKIKSIIAIVAILLCMVYLFWDILDLFKTEDKHKVEVIYSFEALEVTHKLFGFIPIGKDHYYLAYNESSDGVITGYVIKASKDWYEENFYPESGGARFNDYSLNGVVIDSLSKEYRPRWYMEVQDRAVEFQEQIYESNNNYNIEIVYPYGLDHAFVLDYKSTAYLKIALLVFTIVLAAIGVVFAKRKTTAGQVWGRVYLIAVLADVVFFLIILLKSL